MALQSSFSLERQSFQQQLSCPTEGAEPQHLQGTFPFVVGVKITDPSGETPDAVTDARLSSCEQVHTSGSSTFGQIPLLSMESASLSSFFRVLCRFNPPGAALHSL